MGGLTPCMDLVDAVLAPKPGESRQILDLGVYEPFVAHLAHLVSL